jgi:HNH endonuclease
MNYQQDNGSVAERQLHLTVDETLLNATSVVRVHPGPYKQVPCIDCGETIYVLLNRHNKEVRCNNCFEKSCSHICDKCGQPFRKNIKKSKINRPKHCNDCKRKVIHHYDKDELVSILNVAKKTITKILKRAKQPCAICNWNETVCDIHHIISKKYGGSDNLENLIVVCPNCHRIIHSTRKYVIDFLKTKSIEKVFPQWKDFYYEKRIRFRKRLGLEKKQIKNQLEIEKNIQHQIDTVLQAKIDFSKFGWVGEVAKLLNRKPQKINKWMKKYMLTFYETNCFKRQQR